jgi:hypothetical protein
MHDARNSSKDVDPRLIELRVTRLEDDMREVKSDLKEMQAKLLFLEISLARMEGRLVHVLQAPHSMGKLT